MNKGLTSIFVLSLAISVTFGADRGLGWVSGDFGLFQGSQAITWIYSWGSVVPDGKPDNFEYVAMQPDGNNLDQLANNMQSNGATILLGFNEPDNAGQANMSPDDAAGIWRQYILPFGQNGIRLGSPAVTNSPEGIPWLQQFMSSCSDCLVDFIAMHWYGTDIADFQAQVDTMHNAFPDKNIWVTEFALNLDASADQQSGFFDQAVPYLESLGYVERYAWYGASPGDSGNSLIDSSGALTALGQKYVG